MLTPEQEKLAKGGQNQYHKNGREKERMVLRDDSIDAIVCSPGSGGAGVNQQRRSSTHVKLQLFSESFDQGDNYDCGGDGGGHYDAGIPGAEYASSDSSTGDDDEDRLVKPHHMLVPAIESCSAKRLRQLSHR